MKKIYYIVLLSIFLSLIYFSCVRENKITEQKDVNIIKEEIERNELYIFFDTIIKVFPPEQIDEVNDYYFIFKKTDSNDTIFQFSYFGLGFPDKKELEYKGFLKKGSINIAVYDEKDVALNLYKDSLQMKPFSNKRKYVIKKEKHLTPHMIVIGSIRSNKLEKASVTEITKKRWNRYFE